MYNESEIEEMLDTVVEEADESNLWTCRGNGTGSSHPPIIGYGWECPFCAKIEEYDNELEDKSKEIKELEDKLYDSGNRLTETIDEREAYLKQIEELDNSLEEKTEKLNEAFDRYPEFAI